jgi:murein DD-endopeptidase MepM/ murein hydrolase activator NlpD
MKTMILLLWVIPFTVYPSSSSISADSGEGRWYAVPRVELLPSSGPEKLSFRQGQVFLVKVYDIDQVVSSVRAKWKDQTIACFPDNDREIWYGLGGIGTDVKAGDYELIVSVETTFGRKIMSKKSMSVKKEDFPTTKLRVNPRYAVVPDRSKQHISDDRKAFNKAYKTPNLGRLWEGPFARPVTGPVTSPFGTLRIFNGLVNSKHTGVDLGNKNGHPIKATQAGKVVLARKAFIAGNIIIIDHGAGLHTIYCHLSKFKVKTGQMVDKGETIGLVGSTGRVTGPHLHWGTRVQGVLVDPMSLLELNQWLDPTN